MKVGWLIVLFFTLNVSAKILILTYAYKNPKFIEIQYNTFKKFLKNEFEFIVFDNASTQKLSRRIASMCNNLKINYIKVPQEIDSKIYDVNSNSKSMYIYQEMKNTNAIQYAYDTIGVHHNDLLVIVAHDVFLINDFNIREYIKDYHFAGYQNFGVINSEKFSLNRTIHDVEVPSYLSGDLIFINMPYLKFKNDIKFGAGIKNGFIVKIGGDLHDYLKNTSGLKIKFVNKCKMLNLLCRRCQRNQVACAHTRRRLEFIGINKKLTQLIKSIPLLHDVPHIEFYLDCNFLRYSIDLSDSQNSKIFDEQKSEAVLSFINEILT